MLAQKDVVRYVELTIRKKPNEFAKPRAPSPASIEAMMSKPPGVRIIANESQKPPYDDRAVAPKVLPTAISL